MQRDTILQWVETLTNQQQPFTVQNVVRATGIARRKVHEHLAHLVEEGLLTQEQDSTNSPDYYYRTDYQQEPDDDNEHFLALE